MDEGTSANIQNEFFNQARREKRRLAVFLNTGRRLTGRIRSFDKFTILLETAQGDQLVFKHAISIIGPVVALLPYLRISRMIDRCEAVLKSRRDFLEPTESNLLGVLSDL